MQMNIITYRIAGATRYGSISITKTFKTKKNFGFTKSTHFRSSGNEGWKEIYDYLLSQLPTGTHIYGIDKIDIND